MAQSASLAEAKASQARQNLEKYVFGSAVSTVPPVVSPMLPAGVSNYPSYPYVNSPMQWNNGTVPLKTMSMDPTLTATTVFLTHGSKQERLHRYSTFI